MRLLYLLVLMLPAIVVSAEKPAVASLLSVTDSSPHTSQIDTSQRAVVDHEVGLGAIRKVRGFWQYKDSAGCNGLLSRYTWQVSDGFSAVEVLSELEQGLLALEGAELLFACEGRACGHANQWANRVFGQRLLYGKSDEQRYRVIAVEDAAGTARVLLYSSARTADRQYLHADYLLLDSK